MKTYKIALTRTYNVSIKAENEDRAKRLSEFFLGDCPDRSNEKERAEMNFSIEEIEMVYNEADERTQVSNLCKKARRDIFYWKTVIDQ